MSECCIKGFKWDATPKGREAKFAGNNTYITGSNPNVAILVIHDLFGWTFPNIRILADHYAEEVGATVYVPDFFGGEVVPADMLLDKSKFREFNLAAFVERNSKAIRGEEIFAFSKALRSQYNRTGAIGFCFGGWAVFRLGRKGNDLFDCISTAHPSLLERDEIENVGVPVQIMAPEIDPQFTEELKMFSNLVIPRLGVAYDYQFFPGLEHAFAIRGDPNNPAERRGMERAKNAAVSWLREWLYVN
ncbi:hypothetical protein Plec18167_007596 [Paecilomyces lecythidis]|uniref:Dienelactone hydrolase domain-containing protein n=1 Tax=Paecilomyces lecythidis TaxID=3004212 RepID=A0ABR3X2A9_9EURO